MKDFANLINFENSILKISLCIYHLQTPHDRDEIYVIISGKGRFLNNDTEVNFKAEDFLFVPAGIEHSFH